MFSNSKDRKAADESKLRLRLRYPDRTSAVPG